MRTYKVRYLTDYEATIRADRMQRNAGCIAFFRNNVEIGRLDSDVILDVKEVEQ